MNRVRWPDYPSYWIVARRVATALYGITFVLGLLTTTDGGKYSKVLNHPLGLIALGLGLAGLGATVLFGQYRPEEGENFEESERRRVPRFFGLVFMLVGAGFIFAGIRDLV